MENVYGSVENRAGAYGIGRAENAYDGDAEHVCQVHAAGIVAADRAAGGELAHVGGKVGFPGAVDDIGVLSFGDLGGDGAVLGGSEEVNLKFRASFLKQARLKIFQSAQEPI